MSKTAADAEEKSDGMVVLGDDMSSLPPEILAQLPTQLGRAPKSKTNPSAGDRSSDHARAAKLAKTAGGDSVAEGRATGEEKEKEDENDDDDENADDNDEDEDEDLGQPAARSAGSVPRFMEVLPVNFQVDMPAHSKAISALSIERSGARMVTGSLDYELRMYDFNGMNETMQPFRTMEAEDGHPVRSVQYSISGDRLLVVTGSARPKIITREGHGVSQFVRGDMYLHDTHHTKGHTTSCSMGWWHPTEPKSLMTCGLDATVRLWDAEKTENLKVIKIKSKTGGRADCSAAVYSHTGNMICAAGNDGSLQIFNPKGQCIRPDKCVRDAHALGGTISSIKYLSDDVTIISRAMDHTLKVWDVRKFTKAVNVFDNLLNLYDMTDICVSPTEDFIVTGTSFKSKKLTEPGGKTQGGDLVFIERKTMQVVQKVNVTSESVIRTAWNPAINQLVTGCSDGHVRMLYDPKLSKRGALCFVGRKQKRKDPGDFEEHVHVVTPHSLPMFREVGSLKRSKQDKESFKPKKPAPKAGPVPANPDAGLGAPLAPRTIMQQFAMQLAGKKVVDQKSKPDPREELLKLDAIAKADPVYFGRAYKETQPQAIFYKRTEEEEQQERQMAAITNTRKQ